MRALTEFGAREFSVVGLLANGTQMPGRLLQSYKVLGAPEDLVKVAQELEVHGTWLDRVVVTEDSSDFRPWRSKRFSILRSSSDVKVDLAAGTPWLRILSRRVQSKHANPSTSQTRLSRPATAISISEAPLRSGWRRRASGGHGASLRLDSAANCARCRASSCVLAKQAWPFWSAF